MRRNEARSWSGVLFAVLVCLLLSIPRGLHAQAWSGILDSSRATDWTQAGIPGGIPSRTASCPTQPSLLTGSANASANSTAIDNSISACASGGVVSIPSGTWYVAGITFGTMSNVTLRGAGPDQTKLLFTADIPCQEHAEICVEGSNGWPGFFRKSAPWTAGYTKGGTLLTLGTVTGSALVAGDLAVLDQRDDAVGILPAHSEPPVLSDSSSGSNNYTFVVQAIIANGLPYCSTSGGCPSSSSLPATVSNVAAAASGAAISIQTYRVDYSTTCNIYETSPSALLVGNVNCGSALSYTGGGSAASPAAATVVGVSESGTTVTVNTTFAHGFTVGQTLYMGGVTSPGSYCSNGCLGGQLWQGYWYLNGASWSGGVASITSAHAFAGASVGDQIYVSGVNPSGYNGLATIRSISGSTISFNLASNPGSYVSGGMVQDPVNYAGTYTITAVPTSTSFQYTALASGLPQSGGGMASVDTGGAFIACNGGPVCSSEGGSGFPDTGRSCPDTGFGPADGAQCASGEVSWRSEEEFKQIADVCTGSGAPVAACQSASQVIVTPAIEDNNFRTGQAPGIWVGGAIDTLDGIESMTLDYTNNTPGSDVVNDITFDNTYECWVKNVRSVNGDEAHILIAQSARDEVVDSYIYGTKGGHSKSYGVLPSGASDNLMQNNICQHVPDCFIPSGDSGSVYAYNYSVESGYYTADWLNGTADENHDFAFYDLFEGNDVDSAGPDNIHGDGVAGTNFRNRMRGQDTPLRTSASLLAFDDAAFNRAYNLVGNVLGTAPYESAYQTTGLFASGFIYQIGAQADNGGTPNDPLTGETLLRWGNYDTANSAVEWNSSEIPTASEYANCGSSVFIGCNAVPATHTLPDSFYLSAQPAFWQTDFGTPPWPAIGPDVTGGTAPDTAGGYSYAIPAQLCYDNLASGGEYDSSYQQKYSLVSASAVGTEATTVFTGNGTTGSFPLVTTAGYGGVNTIIVSGLDSTFDGTFSTDTVSYNSGTNQTTITYTLPASDSSTFTNQGDVAWNNILTFNATSCYPQADPPVSIATTSVHSLNGVGKMNGAGRFQ